MEQRIRPNTPPVHAAGTDPAYIPGLTAERPPEPQDPAPPDPSAAESAAESAAGKPAGKAAESSAGNPGAPDGPAAGAADTADEAADQAADQAAEDTAGPGAAFEVSDRRGSITADRTGVVFRLDEETAEFDWEEIGAVEISAPRFARRFAVTVYTTGRHRYDADVEAPERRLIKTWTEELEAVLDEYFEETATAAG